MKSVRMTMMGLMEVEDFALLFVHVHLPPL